MRALVLLLIVGCTPVDRSTVRWPAHRKERDARIDELERQVKVLEDHVEKLERQVAQPQPQPPSRPHEPDPPPPQS